MADSCKLLVILGPTASGKSSLATSLARLSAAEILSVDSMQVYIGMDIGTAKPTPVERAEVRHHLIDCVDPTDTYTVAKFVEAADAVIADAAGRAVPLIATGGTPLYYKALFEGLFEGPGADPSLRIKLAELGNEELARRLKEVDPAASLRIHANDTRRLIRALEVYELTGKSISSFQTEWNDGIARHEARWIGLEWDRDALNRRINSRVKEMMSCGWLEETRHLLSKYGPLSATAAAATGYRELVDHIEGRLPLSDAVEQIKIATRQLARRQMKWIRRFPNVTWLKGDQPLDDLVRQATQLQDESRAI